MSSRRDVLRLAELLASAPTVSYREHEVFARIRSELDRYGIPYATDRWGNLLARYRGRRARGRPVAFTAHADHPGLIVTACSRLRAEARWLGGVQIRYFRGSRVRIETEDGPVRGRVRGATLGPNKRVAGVKLDLERSVPVGSIGGWDLVPYRLDPPWIRTRSADDLLGCAGVLSLMKQLAASRPGIEVWAGFTRAEEDGLLGAAALAEAGTMPKETAIVVLETSKHLACGQLGNGVIVRVGDRKSVYDPEICQGLHDTAEELSRSLRSFRYQRCLMDGGVCEATAFQSFGYRAAGLALPLDNYHNMGRRTVREEVVHQDDYWNLTRLLPLAAERIATARDGLAGLREGFRRRLKTARREMVRTRGLGPAPGTSRITRTKRAAAGLVLCMFAAGSILAAPQIEEGVFDQGPITKPSALSADPPSPRSGPRDPREGYDALHYDLFVSLDADNETISGRVTMQLRAEEDLAAIFLDLDESLVVDSAACGGRACGYSRPSPDVLEISLPSLVAEGAMETLVVRYQGTPGPAYFSGFKFFAKHGQEPDEIPIISSLSQPDRARGWWPCKDAMDDKATVSVTIEAPEDFIVAGNGNRTREVVDSSVRRTTWATSYPTATYLVSFAATNYATWRETYAAADGDSVPLLFYAYPEDEADARIDFSVTAQALGVLEEYFGPYPFRDRSIGWEKLGIAEFAWPSGAMEHQTCISYGDGLVTGDHISDWVIAHEIAHQWWGDAVTPTSMDHIWLNEGFATYCEALLAESQDGASGYRRWMRRLWKSPRSEFDGTIVEPMSWFNATVYRKGAWVLHMLRGAMRNLRGDVSGDEVFFDALNEYYDRYRYANASTEDFIRAVEETAHEDLRWFFHPWLYGTGRPHLAWDWQASPLDGDHSIRLFVRQTQPDPDYPRGAPTADPPELFSFPLQVRVFGAGDSLNRSVFVNQRLMTETLEGIPFEPDSIALDPDEWLLREIAPRGEQLPLSQVQVVPNPSIGRVQLTVNYPGPGSAELTIHEITGRTVRHLSSIEGAGFHEVEWDGRNDSGESVASGLYLLRVAGPWSTRTARIMIAR